VLGFLTLVHEHRSLWSSRGVAPASMDHHAELSVFGLGLWGFGDEQVSSCAPHHAELSVFGLGLWGFGDEQVSSCAPLNRAT
jgi:hypothetical protein